MDDSATTSHARSRSTEPFFWQNSVLAPFILLVAFICIGASAGIIISSDQHTVASWKAQPTVLLAILSSVFESVLGAALSIGVAITWKQSALRGTSLARLYYIATRGEGLRFISALSAGPDARKVVLATAIVAIVKYVNNPLLQRATHIKAVEIVTSEPIMLNISQRLPDGWMGTILDGSYDAFEPVIGSRAGLSTAQEWWRNDTITSLDLPGYYCNGTCAGNVHGAGISYNCSSTTQELDLATAHSKTIFSINTTMSLDSTGTPFLLLTTLYSSAVSGSCVATLTIDTCNIVAGVVEYPINIQNSTIALNYHELNNVTALSTYVYPGDLPTATHGAPSGTLQGLNDFYGYYLYALTAVVNPKTYSGNSTFADYFFDADPSSYDDYTFKNCGLKWSSPTEYVLHSMQDFMFRAAMRAGNRTQVQTFATQRRSLALLFHSTYAYLATALAAMLLGVFAVLVLLQGWQELWRTASLDPLETAKVFGAPVMRHRGYKSTSDGMLKDIGLIRVKDGVVVYETSEMAMQGTGQQLEEYDSWNQEYDPWNLSEDGQARGCSDRWK